MNEKTQDFKSGWTLVVAFIRMVNTEKENNNYYECPFLFQMPRSQEGNNNGFWNHLLIQDIRDLIHGLEESYSSQRPIIYDFFTLTSLKVVAYFDLKTGEVEPIDHVDLLPGIKVYQSDFSFEVKLPITDEIFKGE